MACLKLHYFIYKTGFGSIWFGCFDFQCGSEKAITCAAGQGRTF